MTLRAWMGLGLLSATACTGTGSSDDDSDGNGTSDDTDITTPPTTSDLDCDTTYATPAPGAAGLGDCVTEEVTCGSVVHATNLGGSTTFGTGDGEQFEFCSGSAEFDDFAGPERVYKMNAGVASAIHVRLESCVSSWLMYYQGSDVCPTGEVNSCGYATKGDFVDQNQDILIGPSGIVWFVIEGFANNGGNFILTVECL